ASFKLEHGIAVRKTVYATSLEYLMGFSVILTMLIPSGLYLSGVFNLTQGLIATGLVAIFLIVGFAFFVNRIIKVFGFILNTVIIRIARAPIIRGIPFLQHFKPEAYASIERGVAAKAMALSLLSYFTVLARGVIFLKAFNIDINLGEFVLLHVIGYALSCIGLTPVNIGITELSWYGVLTLLGAGHEHAALFAIGQRIINTGTTIFLAVAGYVFYAACKKSGGNSQSKKYPLQVPGPAAQEPQERS
ncbi:MAG: flippase-like domain-containing protein, partial [Candidatus Aminicenantes bacterium]|nr:flippase-like domain-containing protein [Candidatus Aminicenantes bacterium]